MRSNRFPWGIYLRFFVVQALVYNFFLIVLFLVLIPFSGQTPKDIWNLFFSFLVLNLLVAIITSLRFTAPVHRLLLKTLKLSSKKRFSDIPENEPENLFQDEIGEYSQFERALDRISQKLKRRKDQLQRERQETQAFMSSVQEGLLSLDTEGKVLYFNSQFATLFLEQSQLKLDQINLSDIFRAPEIYSGFKKVLEEKRNQKIAFRIPTRIDKKPRDFIISMAPLRGYQSTEVYGVLVVFYDITELKKIEKIRSDFVANASHELRTPLTSIKGYVETLKEDLENGKTDQALNFAQIISRNVNRLIELVNDLLSLSTLESHSELQLEAIHPLEISEIVISELQLLAKEKNQVIHIRGKVDELLADARKVEQVLRNLIMNAIKYIPEGKNIYVVWEKGEGNSVLLKVIDDGPGISEEHHERLFERFYRIDKSRSRDRGGTGLGLAIVKHIMQSHGGQISVKSNPGEGAEFICTFPQNTDSK